MSNTLTNGLTTGVSPTVTISPTAAAAENAALCAVADYLRDAGVRDPHVVAHTGRLIVAKARLSLDAPRCDDPQALTEAAIELVVTQLDDWLTLLADDPSETDAWSSPTGVVGGRLRGLLARYPQAFDQRSPDEQIDALRADVTPVVPKPRPRQMQPQRLRLVPRWFVRWTAAWRDQKTAAVDEAAASTKPGPHWMSHFTVPRIVLIALTFATTIPATWLFTRVLDADGYGLLDAPLTALFGLLCLWVSFSFWTATLGFIVVLCRMWAERRAPPSEELDPATLPPTAIVMPVYNEDTASVFANLKAIAEEIEACGANQSLHLFALSDTTDPQIWLEEERAWAALVDEVPGVRVFYRHRVKNAQRKAGNIADFCRRWGGHYRYMVVLDADSVMAGATLVEMVRRMERDTQVGILQVPPSPVDRMSFFARMQQFASRIYGPVFLEGFAMWTQCDGNYWGHNAIIRIEPFMEHCELPVLPGEGPLGGEILSHDFVEAALMRRGGYKVCVAHDLDGSYEQCPTTLTAYAQRDQRWCQGNLQHMKLLSAEGLHPASRLHLGMGVLSYLASPLWLTFILLTILAAGFHRTSADEISVGSGWLFAVSMTMLLLPKLWGVIAFRLSARTPAERVVRRGLIGSLLLETFTSMLVAPIMMLLHTRFVVSTLLGRKITWNAQQRDDSKVTLDKAVAAQWPQTLCGIGAAVVVWLVAPGLLPWMAPILIGLWLAVPLAMMLGSVRVGRWLGRNRLLLIPEELDPPLVLRRRRAALAAVANESAAAPSSDPFASALWDPAYFALHVGILRATDCDVPMPADLLQQLKSRVFVGGLRAIPRQHRADVLRDREALAALHALARSRFSHCQSAL